MSGAIGDFIIGQSAIGAPVTPPYVPPTVKATTALKGKVTQFTPSSQQNFSFQATLDGALYNVTTTWNVSRQGWYYNVYSQSNTLIVAAPLVGSPLPPQPGANLVGGYFTTSTLFYYPAAGSFVVAP